MCERLREREKQALALLLQGYTFAEIAKELKVAHRTVKAIFHRMYMRYEISNRWVKHIRLIYLWHRGEIK